MKEWTRAERYKKITDHPEEYFVALAEKVDASAFRQHYHIQPHTGLLNDPNGFIHFDGKWHLFYQWFPMGPVHGLKHWYHVTSTDLVHWQDEGIGLLPDTAYDSHGAYSGSGFVKDGQLHIMYTGNVRSKEWERTPNQIVARMQADGSFEKFLPPAIQGIPEGYTDHFRDPKVWKVEDTYYAILGAQRTDETGTAVVYESADALSWKLKGELDIQLPDFGYMWECPDLFEIDGQTVLLFSPQGLEPEGDHYQNIFQTGYVIGKDFQLDSLDLENNGFHELDAGFDFYATQTAESPDGRRILTAWMGLPEMAYPTDREGWAHCLTLPRELGIRNGRLIQRPVRELEELRTSKSIAEEGTLKGKIAFEREGRNSYEMKLTLDLSEQAPVTVNLCEDDDQENRFSITIDPTTKKITIDRSACGIPFGEEYGTARSLRLEEMDQVSLHIFVDTSSIEIFVNDGEGTFTSRIFPNEGEKNISLESPEKTTFNLEIWELG
jgi:beta-fructofuranosidase